MDEVSGKTVVFIGRLEKLPRRNVVRAVEEHGGICRRGITRRTDFVVIGHEAHSLLETGRLRNKVDLADRVRAACISENAFLRALGLVRGGTDIHQITSEEIKAKSGLTREDLRWLSLFDVLEPEDECYGFRDLIAAREAVRLLDEGLSLSDIVCSVHRLRRQGGDAVEQPLARLRLLRASGGEVAIQVGAAITDLDGQFRLPISEPSNPSVDDLFEFAETAEEEGHWMKAEAFYERCVQIDPHDPIALFNLANVVREQGRSKESVIHFYRATAADPEFPEAWYNLAGMVSTEGKTELARDYLLKALELDESYADALYNLARLEFDSGAYRDASEHWNRYLSLDESSDWARKAREGVTLCRHYLGAGA